MHTRPDGKCKEMIHVSQIQMIETYDMSKDSKLGQIAAVEIPLEFSHPIVLYLKKRVVMLWSKSEEDQQIWANAIGRELNEFKA